jgi:type IV pilus assembly protein PilM
MSAERRKRAIGLEIDNGAVRAVEMTGKISAPNLSNLCCIDLPEGAVKEGIIMQPDVVGEALRKMWQKAGFKDREVILGVSNQGVLVRYLTIPKVPADKIKNVVNFQAQENLPIPLESVVLDYLVLGETETAENETTNLEVLIVAAKRDMLGSFLKVLKIANLEPLDIDVASMSLINLLPEKAANMTIVMVNVANGLNSILVSSGGKPRMARLGLVKINDLADNLSCSLEDTCAQVARDDQSRNILTGWVNNLAAEIRSSLAYYNSQPGSTLVEGMLLSGRGAVFEGIADQLEEYLEIPVRIFNPLAAYNPSRRRLVKADIEAIEFVISTGLALRGLEG